MERRSLHFKSAFIKDGEIWCVPEIVNWIIKIDINDWSVKGVCDLDLDKGFSVKYIIHQENSVWGISAAGTKIIEYHMQTGDLQYYVIESDNQRNRGAFFVNNKIWILPIELPGDLVCFDVYEKKFIRHDGWRKECLKNQIKGKTVGFCHDDETVYMTLKDECKIICFNLENGKIKLKKLPGQFGLHSILKVGDELYVTSFKERMIFNWNEKTGKIKKYYCPYLHGKHYAKIVKFKNKILLIDVKETVDVFHMDTGEIRPYRKFPKDLKNVFKAGHNTYSKPLFFEIMPYDGRYFLIPWAANMLLECVDDENETWIGHMLKIPLEIYFEEYILKKLKQNDTIKEEQVKLEEYIDHLQTFKTGYENKMKKTIGNAIYRKLLTDQGNQ